MSNPSPQNPQTTPQQTPKPEEKTNPHRQGTGKTGTTTKGGGGTNQGGSGKK